MTEVERVLWHELRLGRLGWRFRRQHAIPPYIVDFACLEARLVIEADGGQHALAGEHELRDKELRRKGWRILRFWNNDILQTRTGGSTDDRRGAGPCTPALTLPPNPPSLAGEG